MALPVVETEQAQRLPELVKLENLRYTYPQAEIEALKGIDLKVKMGEKIAVVGENGSGKTTLMAILMGLLRNYEGELNVGHLNRDITLASLQAQTACILQDFGQYQMTVRQNIELGNKGEQLTDAVLSELLERVGLLEEVKAIGGLDAQLGQLDNGVELSKGQWQRLAVARLLADPNARIWVLDEPTAYLDPIAEIEVYEMIRALAGDRLVFFISHRLGFARQAERIVVIADGKIAEDGNHARLMAQNGLYRTMFEAQKEWYQSA